VEVGRRLAEALDARGVRVSATPEDAARLKDSVTPASDADLDAGFDLMFALGGDGTFLHAAQIAIRSGTPLLGVNLGRIGFLSALERHSLDDALVDTIIGQDLPITERLTVEGEIVVAGEVKHRLWALNDIAVSKLEPGRLIKLRLAIDNEPFADLSADGIIVSTPTGSTAYSFSAGGPIVSPAVDCLIVTPVSPHLFFDRSIVAGPGEEVQITILPDPDSVGVSPDGRRWVEAGFGATVLVRPSRTRLRLAVVEPAPFWRLVRTKFGLPTPD
ncbi:MAG TPA: NAD(+)/NADH kinase, partial [Actinomycetota bacterium]|nr:NAD(+)/NADH kinase [Actinomycetota bacterium]